MSANELTDEQINAIDYFTVNLTGQYSAVNFARAVIAADRSLRSDSVHQAGALPNTPAATAEGSEP